MPRTWFAEYRGNRQYISMGNLKENDRCCLFLMDYPGRMRLKIWGRARFVEGDAALLAKVEDPEYGAKVERVFVFTVDVMDGNCPQHICPESVLGFGSWAMRRNQVVMWRTHCHWVSVDCAAGSERPVRRAVRREPARRESRAQYRLRWAMRRCLHRRRSGENTHDP